MPDSCDQTLTYSPELVTALEQSAPAFRWWRSRLKVRQASDQGRLVWRAVLVDPGRTVRFDDLADADLVLGRAYRGGTAGKPPTCSTWRTPERG